MLFVSSAVNITLLSIIKNILIPDSPIVEIIRAGDETQNEVVELDSLSLECEVRANPPVEKFRWYFNVSI